MKKIILLTFLSICLSSISHAKDILCKTARSSKDIIIQNNSVTFYINSPTDASKRIPASMNNVRTRMNGQGFSKSLYFEGKKHLIKIKNVASFSEVDDYMIIRSKEGHEMIYPLTCNLI